MITKESIDRTFDHIDEMNAHRLQLEKATHEIKADNEQKRAKLKNLKAIEEQIKDKGN